jgi:hypothetical protein
MVSTADTTQPVLYVVFVRLLPEPRYTLHTAMTTFPLFLTSIVCGESDRLLDTRCDLVGYQQEGTPWKRIIKYLSESLHPFDFYI